MTYLNVLFTVVAAVRHRRMVCGTHASVASVPTAA